MKSISFKFLLFVFTITSFMSHTLEAQQREFYQLIIYSFDNDEQIKTTDNYLKNAYLPALKKMGIEHVGVFKTRLTEEVTETKTYVLIPSTSLDVFDALEFELSYDKEYMANGSDYINASYDNAPFKRKEAIILKAFEDMPFMKPSRLTGPREDRIYELRSYQSATEALYRNKVTMFNAGGEVKLFADLDFNAVFYGEVLAGSNMPNLMYMTTHANQETRDANWKTFINAPIWKEISSDPKYQHNVSKNTQFFLYPTEYSDY